MMEINPAGIIKDNYGDLIAFASLEGQECFYKGVIAANKTTVKKLTKEFEILMLAKSDNVINLLRDELVPVVGDIFLIKDRTG